MRKSQQRDRAVGANPWRSRMGRRSCRREGAGLLNEHGSARRTPRGERPHPRHERSSRCAERRRWSMARCCPSRTGAARRGDEPHAGDALRRTWPPRCGRQTSRPAGLGEGSEPTGCATTAASTRARLAARRVPTLPNSSGGGRGASVNPGRPADGYSTRRVTWLEILPTAPAADDGGRPVENDTAGGGARSWIPLPEDRHDPRR